MLTVSIAGQSQNPAESRAEMDYYLPQDVTYNPSIPTPEEVIGFVPGEWHVRHDQLVNYMYTLAKASNRITINEYARSYEDRPLLVLTITSPANHGNIEQIRRNHLALTDPEQSSNMDLEQMPVVTYMGYSVHGDEASGTNAAMLVAYYLAAANGPEISAMLNNTVVLLDPSFNPDGLNRFAHWVNTHKSKNQVVDPNNMEQNQPWPGGRTNHYWFDLNRDYMLVQHPESQGRIEMFHLWKPNILTDHHEMGTNATFFFQPGIPSRTHPLTPDRNQQLTAALAEYHARSLDNDKRLYYTRESFDDFYYGKGSTYPDINGSVGILFEQASSRSHAQESIHGVLKFPFAIKNHFLASLSTLEGAQELRIELLDHQRTFYQEAAREAQRSAIKGYVFGSAADRTRSYHLAELLDRHQIKVHMLSQDLQVGGQAYTGGKAYVVPAEQKQFRLVKALFERRTSFPDSLFYDVSAWTMPYAFNLPFAELESREYSDDLLGPGFKRGEMPKGTMIGEGESYAYLFEWDEYYAPRALYRLQKAGVRAKVASEPFTAVTAEGPREFDYGTIMIPVGPQDTEPSEIHSLMQQAVNDGLDIYNVQTGLTPAGIDLGSGSFEELDRPRVAIISGDGTSGYEVGEDWHLLDQRFNMEATLLTKDRLRFADLDRYNVMIMVSGGYGDLTDNTVDRLRRWIGNGNVLITTRYANSWAENKGLANISFVNGDSGEDEEQVSPKPYATLSRTRGAQFIGGTIFHAEIDLTHPIGYGFNDDRLTVFRNTTSFMERADNPYATPLRYTDDPLASGYVSDENLEQVKGTAAIVVSRRGGGRVISMIDNPNFRAFWYGTNKLFMNAIFFGQTISGSSAN